MRLWPWKKKKIAKKSTKRVVKKEETKDKALEELQAFQQQKLDEMRKRIASLAQCPEPHRIAHDCLCMDCKKKDTCGAEKERRSKGCSDVIIVCSLRHQMQANNPDSVSDFADIVTTIMTRRIVNSLTQAEKDEINKARAKAKAQEEEKNAKEKGSKGPDIPSTGNGPRCNM